MRAVNQSGLLFVPAFPWTEAQGISWVMELESASRFGNDSVRWLCWCMAHVYLHFLPLSVMKISTLHINGNKGLIKKWDIKYSCSTPKGKTQACRKIRCCNNCGRMRVEKHSSR